MMGHRQVEQAALFYEFSLERHIPADHLLRSIDRFVELGGLRREPERLTTKLEAWVRRRVRPSSPRSFATAGLRGFEGRRRGRSTRSLRLGPNRTLWRPT
jgi:hypothetical protein